MASQSGALESSLGRGVAERLRPNLAWIGTFAASRDRSLPLLGLGTASWLTMPGRLPLRKAGLLTMSSTVRSLRLPQNMWLKVAVRLR